MDVPVRDSEIGIQAYYADKIADPYFQVDGTLAWRYEGSRLGLALCKMFVELHGGSLIVASQFGEGAVVTARFPANIVMEEQASV